MEEKKKSHEIDVVALSLFVLKDWKRLCIFGFVGGLFGIFIAFNIPKTYTATVILAPEMSAGGTGMADNLAEMASNFGIDLGSKSSMDAIYPEIYPDIYNSTDFVHQLFDVKVRLIDDNSTRTYLDHIMHECKLPFWDYPRIWLAEMLKKPDPMPKNGGKGFVDPFRIPRRDAEICEGISKTITCLIDKKTSVITISFTDQDPMVAAIMVDTLQCRLQAYITEYRTHKARIDYNYYDKMVRETEKEYQKAENAYAGYSDSHLDAVLSSVSTREQTLEQNMSNAYTSYAAMIKMRDQAKAKIQECTPAFTIIQSAKTPFKPSSRPRIVTALLFAILGGIIGSIKQLRLYSMVKEKSN